MNRLDRFRFVATLVSILIAFGFFVDARALGDKELWLKNNAARMEIRQKYPQLILDHGGPDEGGYYYIDSDDDAMNAPVFDWVDISDIGTPVVLDDDDNQGPFDLDFDFTFYGNPYTSIYICSNGWVSFTSESHSAFNVRIPGFADPNDLLAVFWDDLAPDNGGEIYYFQDADNNRFIISYDGVPHYYNEGALYFQVVLYEDGMIIYQYASMDDGGHGNDGATVGIENGDGSIGTQYLYNQDIIHDDMAIYFGLIPPIYANHDVRPTTILSPGVIGEVGDLITPVVRFVNVGINMESFIGRVIVNYDGEIYNEAQEINDLDSGSSIEISFPDFTPEEEGTYEFITISELDGDENTDNDTLRQDYEAFPNIYIEYFEDDEGAFTGDEDWEWGEPVSGPGDAHSGVNVWGTVLNGSYTVGPLLSALISPALDLSNNAILTFWHWYDIENGFDGGNVKISTDDGAVWEIITPDDGYDGIISDSYENPIGGEEAFFGSSGGWVMETFDLSAHGGSSVLLKFDFGSDNSVNSAGWYIDDFIVYGGNGADPGWITGVVTDLSTSNPIEGAVVGAGVRRDTTDADGSYILSLIPGIYSVTASAIYYNSVTVDDVVITEGDTTIQDFALPAPAIQVDTTPIDTSMQQGEIVTFIRNVANMGDGYLDFTISISMADGILNARRSLNTRKKLRTISAVPEGLYSENTEAAFDPGYADPPIVVDFGDEVFTFDPQTPTNDMGCLGVEFDGNYFWVTGRNPTGEDIHKLHKFDRNGNHLESFDQGTVSAWGWRDLAWDGNFLYASDENELAILDPATGQKVGEIPMPTSIYPPMRALAYDPATDHFWSANFASNIIEFDRDGVTLGTYPNDRNAYGMAWDDVSEDGPWLWVFSQDGDPLTQISQYDPRTGSYTGVEFYAIDHNGGDPDRAGGACFTTEWEPALAVLFCLVQGRSNGESFDMVQGYEIAPFSRWLTVDPVSGMLGPGEDIDLTITIDFTGDDIVPDSIYNATIIINNNSSETPEISVTAHPIPTAITGETSDLPRQFALYQNYPNPFNPVTEIRFALPEKSDVTIEIFNILGQKVTTLFSDLLPAGYHKVIWDGSGAASGLYFYRLAAGSFINVKKMMLLK